MKEYCKLDECEYRKGICCNSCDSNKCEFRCETSLVEGMSCRYKFKLDCSE